MGSIEKGKAVNSLNSLEAQDPLAGEVDKISAMVDHCVHDSELDQRVANLERELIAIKATAETSALNPLRRTIPASTTKMLAKHGIDEGPVDVQKLDAALAGLSLEQRIAVKTQLLRAGAIA